MSFRTGLCGLLALLVAVIVLAAAKGTVQIPSTEMLSMLLRHAGFSKITRSWPDSDEIIILHLRLPRVLGAAGVGAALAIAGTLFQGLLRNPLADPYVIGTSGGAAL